MTTGIIIQAHSNSTRLPKKVLLQLGDMSILEHVVCSACQSISDLVIIATTSDISNVPIIDLVKTFSYKYPKLHVFVYDGPDEDVLGRYYNCAGRYNLGTICRITSDCPLHTPHIIDLCIKLHSINTNDYTSFSAVDGLDTEIFSFKVLEEAHNNAKEPLQREHVTTHIKERSSLKKGRLEDTKLSIDTQEDLDRVWSIYDKNNKV